MLVHGPALLQGAGEGAAAEQLARADALELVHERRNLGIDVDVDLVMPLAAGAGLDLDIGEREILVEGDGDTDVAERVHVSIDAASVDTRVEMRDKDLRSDHFLDVEKYPTITFKSKKVETPAAGKLKITGDLTVHGVTKEVVLDVDGPSQPAKDGKGNLHMGASAETTIDRTEFGMTG